MRSEESYSTDLVTRAQVGGWVGMGSQQGYRVESWYESMLCPHHIQRERSNMTLDSTQSDGVEGDEPASRSVIF